MYFLLAAFVLGDAVTVFAQDHEREFAAEMEQRRMDVQAMLKNSSGKRSGDVKKREKLRRGNRPV